MRGTGLTWRRLALLVATLLACASRTACLFRRGTVVIAGRGWLQLLVAKEVRRNGKAPYILTEQPDDARKYLNEGEARVVSVRDWQSAVSSANSIVICAEPPIFTRSTVEDLLSAAKPRNLDRILLLSQHGVSRRGSDAMFRVFNLLGDLDRAAETEAATSAEADRLGAHLTVVRTGPLKGGGGAAGLGKRFYDVNPDYAGALEDKSFDLNFNGVDLRGGDAFRGEKTSRISVARALAGALGRAGGAGGKDPREFSVRSKRRSDPLTEEEWRDVVLRTLAE